MVIKDRALSDRRSRLGPLSLAAAMTITLAMISSTPAVDRNEEPMTPGAVVLSDDGGWCWFEDPRALIAEGKLVAGAVANGRFSRARKGDIEAITYDPRAGSAVRSVLYDRLEADDHDSPAFLLRPDGRLLSVFAMHGKEAHFYYRLSEPHDFSRWGPIRTFAPSHSTRLTYSNLYRLPAENGRIYNFYRGLDGSPKPSYAYSDDGGETWTGGGMVIRSPGAPYVRYASDGYSAIHLIYTEDHPRHHDTSLYHVRYSVGQLRRSDGSPIRALRDGLTAPEEGTRLFTADADHVAWPSDVELDAAGNPVVVYSVQVGSAGLPRRQGGMDIRYRYARWDGSRWLDYPLAYAGTRLYPGEDDYAGLAAIDPDNPAVVYLSTNADPQTGAPSISRADGERHYEIFRAVTSDGGSSWSFSAITRDSAADNLRPIVPARGDAGWTMLLWLRGTYRTYQDYSQEIIGMRLGSP